MFEILQNDAPGIVTTHPAHNSGPRFGGGFFFLCPWMDFDTSVVLDMPRTVAPPAARRHNDPHILAPASRGGIFLARSGL